MEELAVAVEKHYPAGGDWAAFDLAVSFRAGDGVTVLFGPSGAGKTLTLESIAGFARPDKGCIRLGDDTLFDSSAGIDLPARKRRCGYVFQKDALFPHMTIRQNLEFAAQSLDADSRRRRIDEILASFRLSHLGGRRPQKVSGGERQRCSIARTLVSRPRLILLDEPTRGLDVSLRNQLYEVLARVRQQYRMPMILITHDLEEAFRIGDRMLVYERGRIVQQGPPHQVYEQPRSEEVARLLGISDVLEGSVCESDPAQDATLLQVGDLKVSASYIDGCRAGDRVRFCIRPERVLAGPLNGAPLPHQLTLRLERSLKTPTQVRLEFAGGFSARVPKETVEPNSLRAGNPWVVEFPRGSIWIFRREAKQSG